MGAADLYKSIGLNGSVEFSDRPSGMARAEEPGALDAAIQHANAQVDLAERAFAVARRAAWTRPDAGPLAGPRMSRTQLELIAFHDRNVVATRQVLVKVLQQKHLAAARGELMASSVTPAGRP